MQRHSIQTVFKAALLLVLVATLGAREIPIRKNVTLEVSLKEFSVINFPFKVTKIQLGVFTYQERKDSKPQKNKAIENSGAKKISLSKKTNTKATPTGVTNKNILNIKKIDKIITVRPDSIGEVEAIVWGNRDYPMVVKIKVVEVADQDITFVHVVDERKLVTKFESGAHERVIELLMRSLFNEDVNPRPRGYESIVRKEVYDVGIEDNDGFVYTRVQVALTKEFVGKKYVGQVWNVNMVPEFDSDGETISMPDDFRLQLFYEMFDSEGVYSISLETYEIDKKHGTRLMLVRSKDS